MIHPVAIKTPPRFFGLEVADDVAAVAAVFVVVVVSADVGTALGGITRGIGGRGWREVDVVPVVLTVDRDLGRNEITVLPRRKSTQRFMVPCVVGLEKSMTELVNLSWPTLCFSVLCNEW